MRKINARAPSKVTLNGTGVDVKEYFKNQVGKVLNMGIDLYTYVSVLDTKEKYIRVVNENWGVDTKLTDLKLYGNANTSKDNVDIVKATLNYMQVTPDDGLEIHIMSTINNAPGLASSSALISALLAAVGKLKHNVVYKKTSLTAAGYNIEKKLLKRKGGYQEHVASVYGGLNYIEFTNDKIEIDHTEQLPLSTETEFHSRVLLFEVPVTRGDFSHNLEVLKEREMQNKLNTIAVLDKINSQTKNMYQAITTKNIDKFGDLVMRSWAYKKQLPLVTNTLINSLHDIGIINGALGGKLVGVGQGGYMFFVVPLINRNKVINALEKEGMKNINYNLDHYGTIVWEG